MCIYCHNQLYLPDFDCYPEWVEQFGSPPPQYRKESILNKLVLPWSSSSSLCQYGIEQWHAIVLDLHLSITTSHLADIVNPPSWMAPYTTFAWTRSPLQNNGHQFFDKSNRPTANPLGYINSFGSLPDHLVTFKKTPSIAQQNRLLET